MEHGMAQAVFCFPVSIQPVSYSGQGELICVETGTVEP